jgi:hypothetical protein
VDRDGRLEAVLEVGTADGSVEGQAGKYSINRELLVTQTNGKEIASPRDPLSYQKEGNGNIHMGVLRSQNRSVKHP